MCPSVFQMKIFGCGCSRECIQMAWWQKNWQDREQWQNLFSRKSENLYKEKFPTPRKNLAEHPIEVHSSVFCWCHQKRMTTGGQWTPKSKGSFFVTCHYSKTKVVSIFMQHTVLHVARFGSLSHGSWFTIGWNSQAKQDRCTSHLEGSPQLRQVRSARYYEVRAWRRYFICAVEWSANCYFVVDGAQRKWQCEHWQEHQSRWWACCPSSPAAKLYQRLQRTHGWCWSFWSANCRTPLST